MRARCLRAPKNGKLNLCDSMLLTKPLLPQVDGIRELTAFAPENAQEVIDNLDLLLKVLSFLALLGYKSTNAYANGAARCRRCVWCRRRATRRCFFRCSSSSSRSWSCVLRARTASRIRRRRSFCRCCCRRWAGTTAILSAWLDMYLNRHSYDTPPVLLWREQLRLQQRAVFANMSSFCEHVLRCA